MLESKCAASLGAALAHAEYNSDEKTMRPVVGAVLAAGTTNIPDLIEPAAHPNHRQFFHSVAFAGILGWGAYKVYEWEPEHPVDKAIRFVLLVGAAGYLTISQTWEKIRVYLNTGQSSSRSKSASLVKEPGRGYVLMYSYQNEPKIGEPELRSHVGYCELLLNEELTTAEGALEATLVITAALLRYERWQSLRSFLKYPYLVRTDHDGIRAADITEFEPYLVSMDEHRNIRLRANRACLTADMLKERCSTEHTPFRELVQADVFLALYGVAHCKASENSWMPNCWAPRTSVYTSEAKSLPLFLKAVDTDFRAGIFTALGVSSASDLAARVEAARPLLEDFRHLSLGRFPAFNFVRATNLQTLIQ